MQKVLYKPICHFSQQQAAQILQQIRFSTFDQKRQNPSIGKQQSTMIINNNSTGIRNSESRNIRMPSLQTFPALYSNQNENLNNINNAVNQQSNKKSKISIIGNYKEFSHEKDNFDKIKQENSRLHFEKLALQAAVNKLKEENLRKDQQIARLKELVNQGKPIQQGIMENKNFNVGGPIQQQHGNRNQVHFFSTFQNQRRPF